MGVVINLIDLHTEDHQPFQLLRNFMISIQSRRSKFLQIRIDALVLGGCHTSTLSLLKKQCIDQEMKYELYNDEEVMLKFIDFDGRFYWKVGEKLQDHHLIKKRAVQQNGMMLLEMDEGGLTRDLILEAVKEDGLALQVDFDLLNSEICRLAALNNGMALDHIPLHYRSKEIVELGSNEHPYDSFDPIENNQIANRVALHRGLYQNSYKDNTSKEILEDVVKLHPFSQPFLLDLNLSGEEIYELTLKCVQCDGDVSAFIDIDEFSMEQCKELVKYDGKILSLIDDNDQSREMILNAVQNDGESLEFASKKLVDAEIVIEAIRKDAAAIQHSELKHSKSFLVNCAKENGEILCYLDEQYGNDREIVMASVSNYGMALGYASGELQADYEIVMLAVSNCGLALEFANDELREREDVILKAVSQNGLALGFALHQNETIVETALNQCVLAFSFISPQWVTKEIALKAVKRYPYLFKEDNIPRSDRELSLCAVEGWGGNLGLVLVEFTSDREIVMKAVSNCGLALQYAHEDLQDDDEVVYRAIINNSFSMDFASDRLKLDWKLLRLYKELQKAELDIFNAWEEEFPIVNFPKREREDEVFDGDDDLEPNYKLRKL